MWFRHTPFEVYFLTSQILLFITLDTRAILLEICDSHFTFLFSSFPPQWPFDVQNIKKKHSSVTVSSHFTLALRVLTTDRLDLTPVLSDLSLLSYFSIKVLIENISKGKSGLPNKYTLYGADKANYEFSMIEITVKYLPSFRNSVHVYESQAVKFNNSSLIWS